MKRIDLLLKRAEQFEKLAVYGDRKSFLKALSQSQTEAFPPPVQQEYLPEIRQQMGLDKVPVTQQQMSGLELTPEQGALKPIPKETQVQLNQLLVDPANPQMSPLRVDGLLGPETIAACRLFRKKFNMPATVANIKSKYLEVRNPELSTKAPF